MTTVIGKVTNVTIEANGSALALDVSIGATQFPVDDAFDFPAEGGSVEVLGVEYVYTSVDYDADILFLAGPTAVALSQDEIVYSLPKGATKYAQVDLDDSDEGIVAEVPFSSYDLFPDGIRDEADQETVTVNDEFGYWQVDRVMGQEPLRDMSYSDPSTYEGAGIVPVTVFQDAIDAIEADFTAAYAAIASGDSTNATAISNAVADFNAGLATKSKNTQSTSLPGSTANNAGDVWERLDSVTSKVISRWRGLGGTSWAAMNLDAVYIPQIDIGTGTFGDLTGTRILAKTIAVDKMLVSDLTNLNPDPGFNGFGWTYTGGAYLDPTYADLSGTPSGVLVLPFGPASFAESNKIEIKPGEDYALTWDERNTASASADSTFYVRYSWFDAGGTPLSPSYTDILARTSSTIGTVWTRVSGHTVAPVGAYKMSVSFIRYNVSASGYIVVDNVKLSRRFGGELVVDGTILARHITADMVNGLLATLGTIQTDAAANRGIKISTSGLIGYNTSGVATTVIDPTTGRIFGTEVTVQTGSTGERILLRQDGSGGVIEAYTGAAGETNPARIDPYLSGSQPGLQITAGSTSTYAFRPSITLLSNTSGNTIIDLGASTINTGGVLWADSGIRVNNGYANGTGVTIAGGGIQLMTNITCASMTSNATTAAPNVFANSGGLIVRTSFVPAAASAAKLKENIRPLELECDAAINAYRELSLKLYDYREDIDDVNWAGKKDMLGVIADEAMGTSFENFVIHDSDGDIQTFDYGRAAFVMGSIVHRCHDEEIKELKRRLELVEAR